MTNDRDVVKMMSERDVVKETSNDERKPISPSAATRIVQIGAALLLGGGFYYGFTRQQRIVVDEKLLPPHEKRAHQQVRIRSATFLERKLGLDRPRNPGSAAGRALLGGTIVAVSGFAVLISAVGAVLGVSNIEQFRLRMEQISSGVGKNMSKVMAIEQTPRPSEFASEEEEMEHLSAIFEESMKVNDVAAEAHAVELDKQAQS
ncbi:hypothetical protein Poli38472_009861 [Pythium oligandrum]|uniref:Transmembrane protein 242 n=1 Tax=Pythium oligandrum TaxID=41045 RepID=A0A8K1FL64_PYTOL|nr:hypothetical protein Poli38472_009861 [Pythium oligandrum]|eukprot:TMW62368.1 hypothetical protein Poli38472_009861 [Pythium oligandrum]